MRIPRALYVTDPVDRMLHQAGIPRQLWYSQLKQVKYTPTKMWGARFDAIAQRQVVLDYLEHIEELKQSGRIPQRSFTAVVSSSPTDTGAQQFCAALMRRVARVHLRERSKLRGARKESGQNRLELRYVNVADWDRPRKRDSREPDLVVAWNLTASSDATTVDRARNLLYFYHDSVRVLALAGITKPEDWSLNQLRYRPDVVFMVKDTDLGQPVVDLPEARERNPR